MVENNRKPIASLNMFPQFTTMNVIDGQAGIIIYSSLICYSLTIDNILNIIVLLILAGVTVATLTGDNGLLTKAWEAKQANEGASALEKIKVEVAGSYSLDGKIDIEQLNTNLKRVKGLKYNDKDIILDGDNKNKIEELPVEVIIDNNSFFIDKNGDVLDWKNADLINSKIGNIVDGYSAADLQWQVFYSEPIETYLISKTMAKSPFPVPINRKKQNEEENEYTYRGSEDVRKLTYGAKWNKKWLKKCLNNENINATSAKATAYMCDPVNWREYAIEGLTNYAVGGPTVELLIASYNKSQGTRVELLDKDVTTLGIDIRKPDELGKTAALNWSKNNGAYSTGFQEHYHTATPGGEYGDRLIYVDCDGIRRGALNRSYYYAGWGVRPIVSIPTSKISVNGDTVTVNL